MKREQSGPFLSAVFVDYDNIYLSLKRKSDEAAKLFARDASVWLKNIENGSLITPTNGLQPKGARRIVMNRCYGNPVPRRNASDNSTDMSSFPFVRHHFLRAGFEVVDCPPLTAQLKNSSDIRMVMDLRDYLDHETHFDEFIILSGDADFTPVLHRLRAHARRTVIYATDYTAAPYTAISDGEVREADLIQLLIEGRTAIQDATQAPAITASATPSTPSLEATRRAIIDDVVSIVRAANAPVPLEVLADHAVRNIGHERVIGTSWGGAGGFRELLAQGLPQGYRLSGEPPYVVIDLQRHMTHQPIEPVLSIATGETARLTDAADYRSERSRPLADPDLENFGRFGLIRPQQHNAIGATASASANASSTALTAKAPASQAPAVRRQTPELSQPATPAPSTRPEAAVSIQQSIARIHEACKAPPLAPPEYRALFEIIALEITENGLIGAQTIQNIALRAQERGIDVRRDDVRFVLEVVSEADPWFEQGASANLFAGRFRNFVVARCRAQGLSLSADELDLVEAWFAGNSLPQQSAARQTPTPPTFGVTPPLRPAPSPQIEQSYWAMEEARGHGAPEARPRQQPAAAAEQHAELAADDFPRIVRTRLRG